MLKNVLPNPARIQLTRLPILYQLKLQRPHSLAHAKAWIRRQLLGPRNGLCPFGNLLSQTGFMRNCPPRDTLGGWAV